MNEAKNKHAVALGKLGGAVGGKSSSPKKIAAARINGKLGGRPKRAVHDLVRRDKKV